MNLMLLNRLVCSVNDPQIQKWLLTEDKLIFEKAIDISLALEGVTATSATPSNSVLVPIVLEGESSPSIKYYCCGKPNYKAPGIGQL